MGRAVIVVLIVVSLSLIAVQGHAQDTIQQPEATAILVTPWPTYTYYPTYTPVPQATEKPVAPTPAPPLPRPWIGLDQRIMEQADLEIHQIQLQIERFQTARISTGADLVQLPTTHADPPSEIGAAPDPSRRSGIDSWYSAAIDLQPSMIVSVRIDIYSGPSGVGYILVAEMINDGRIWNREINIGPESYRGHDWQLMENDS